LPIEPTIINEEYQQVETEEPLTESLVTTHEEIWQEPLEEATNEVPQETITEATDEVPQETITEATDEVSQETITEAIDTMEEIYFTPPSESPFESFLETMEATEGGEVDIERILLAQITQLNMPNYTADSVVLMDAATGLILYATDPHELHYPASITKIMTALIVLENIYDLSERVEFSYNAVFSIPRNSSHIYMDVRETLTVYEALHGLMLASANEVSIALAEHVAGSVESFVELMNHRAHSLGARNTHFVNPTGLPATEQLTTAYDMALIMREAVKHPVFVNIISTRSRFLPPTERQAESRPLLNTHHMIHPGRPHFNEHVIGGKTGFTNQARHTLVTYANYNGRRLIVSILRADNPGVFIDTSALLDFGFSIPFEEIMVFEADVYTPTVPVYQNVDGQLIEVGRVTLQANNDISFTLPYGFDRTQLRYNLSIPEALQPPVQEGEVLGRVAVYVQNLRVGEENLFAQNAVLPYVFSLDNTGYYVLNPDAYYSHTYDNYETFNPHYWVRDYVYTFMIPLIITGIMIAIATVLLITRRKRRMSSVTRSRGRYARYDKYTRYKGDYYYR